MRQQFVKTIEEIIRQDERLVLILGDIGVHGFRNVMKEYSDRVYNIGILEQTTIGLGSGLAMTGFIPVIHTIAPFLVERALEQIKVDFGYQKLNGNFISVGASYDYAGLGCTHHCPGDVTILKSIPNLSIICPGTANEFDLLFKQSYADDNPTYFRLSEEKNDTSMDVNFGESIIVKRGSGPIIIAIGPMLKRVLEASFDLDVTILYITTIRPLDTKKLSEIHQEGKMIIVCEPFYSGSITQEITECLSVSAIIKHIGVPHKFINNYGTIEENNKALNLDTEGIRSQIKTLL